MQGVMFPILPKTQTNVRKTIDLYFRRYYNNIKEFRTSVFADRRYLVDDYKQIIAMIERIKDNQKALSYIKGFLQAALKRYK